MIFAHASKKAYDVDPIKRHDKIKITCHFIRSLLHEHLLIDNYKIRFLKSNNDPSI